MKKVIFLVISLITISFVAQAQQQQYQLYPKPVLGNDGKWHGDGIGYMEMVPSITVPMVVSAKIFYYTPQGIFSRSVTGGVYPAPDFGKLSVGSVNGVTYQNLRPVRVIITGTQLVINGVPMVNSEDGTPVLQESVVISIL